ncbi:MAG: malto-oligosyltrehalose synthase [Desulfohalobiaceae bacterium]|nr:malto-oligosyltrehalose synthase [Desulfohalobiaceae bacterium]
MSVSIMHIPIATYRIQFRPDFGFSAAEDIVGYLSDLGVSTIYASPVFKARKGSEHGYDIVDPTRLNPELGSPGEFEKLTRQVREKGLTWLQDFVPNHMAFSRDNLLLRDVLSCGQHSGYAPFFDIDFEHVNPNLKSRLLAPFLGTPLREALQKGDLRLHYEADGFCLQYFDLILPLNPEAHWAILKSWPLETDQLGELKPQDQQRLCRVLDLLRDLASTFKAAEACSSQFSAVKRILWEIHGESPEFRDWLQNTIQKVNQIVDQDVQGSFLAWIVSRQFYRLSYFRTAMQEINYRRFFTINDLICLNMDSQEAFEHVHKMLFELVGSDSIQGVRIDHFDGLSDPPGYLRVLRARMPETYLVIEKILEERERIPKDWPVQGTTGYDSLNIINRVFVDTSNRDGFNRIYEGFLDQAGPSAGGQAAEKKRLILETEMQGDLESLSYQLLSFISRYRPLEDVTLPGLRQAIAELLVHLPVYRTYITPDSCSKQDRDLMQEACARAGDKAPEVDRELQVLKDLFFGLPVVKTAEEEEALRACLVRFQQLSGPLMAKGFEDTYLYCNNRLLSLNEVGGSPDCFGLDTAAFHEIFSERAKQWPASMLASATHDTKRGEDVRARLNVLSELPREWEAALDKWNRVIEEKSFPAGRDNKAALNEVYLLYQTLLGAFPFSFEDYPEFRQRIKDYMLKAVREAKLNSGWLSPDEEYETGLQDLVDRLLPVSGKGRFLLEFLPLQSRIAAYGLFNSLAQTLLKLTLPGVPDIYQGCELWDLSLVDPDNRRPVDYEKRKQILEYIREASQRDLSGLAAELLESRQDGRVKLFLIFRALQVRNSLQQVFAEGEYVPLSTRGEFKNHVLAFARTLGEQWVISLVPRFLTTLIEHDQVPIGREIWKDTCLVLPKEAPGRWREGLTGKSLEGEQSLFVGEILERFPVGLLVGAG